MAKPDHRGDNVEHLQQAIDDTMANIRASEEQLEAHADDMNPKDKADLQSKNERRREAIEGFRAEIRDEAAYRQQRDE